MINATIRMAKLSIVFYSLLDELSLEEREWLIKNYFNVWGDGFSETKPKRPLLYNPKNFKLLEKNSKGCGGQHAQNAWITVYLKNSKQIIKRIREILGAMKKSEETISSLFFLFCLPRNIQRLY